MKQTATTEAIAYRKTDVAQILQLRHQVLRQGYPINEVMFAEDDDLSSLHFGAFDPAGKNICCLSFLPSEWEGRSAWRLRAMATMESHRNQGIGSKLLRFSLSVLENENGIQPIWCNARVSATTFYRRFGWVEVSKPFSYENAGPSITMLRL